MAALRESFSLAALLLLGSCSVAVAQPADSGSVGASGTTGTAAAAKPASPFGLPFGKVRPLASGIVFDEPPIQGGVIRGIAPDGVTSLSLDGEPVDIMPDRAFIIAFNRDAPRRAVLSVGRADGSQAEETLDVSPREWRIERVNVAMRGSTPSEAYMALRRPELEQIGLARAIRSDSQGWRQQFIWPVKGRISGLFGSQRVYRGEPGSFHSGVDVSTGTSGTPIVAPADGVVILAADKPFTLEGNLLMLDHGMGLNSAFLHLSEISVKPGEAVRQGQVIGRIGATGRATGPHLHWSMKWRDARIDPLLLAGPMD